jgi:hypothetical protein
MLPPSGSFYMFAYPQLPFAVCGPTARPLVELCRWPGGRPFALFLSHDVGQVRGRDFYRMSSDMKHNRRRILPGGPSGSRPVCHRAARGRLRAQPDTKGVETLLAIEGRHGFRSTFFLVHDENWVRQGAWGSLQSPEIQTLVHMVLDARCELGVHGGFHRFNNAALYRESLDAVESAFGVRPCGIRNHLLRFSYPETWRSQAEAGFGYDATYGLQSELGPRGGWPFPFQTCDASTAELLDLYELPVTVMDATLFGHLRLAGVAALEKAWEVVWGVIGIGGLVSLLWHKNHFNQLGHADGRRVYEELLNRLAPLKPWCATGAEINSWWRAKSAVSVQCHSSPGGKNQIRLYAPQIITNLALDIGSTGEVRVDHAAASVDRINGGTRMIFPRLPAGETVTIKIAR